MEDNKDVGSEDLYEELRKTLEKEKEPEAEEASVASDQKPEGDGDAPKDEVTDENADLREEEISKLTPRAQKRIRALADEVKKLAEKPAEKSPETPPEEKPEAAQSFKNVKEFLDAVEDEPSRKLLEKFYRVIKGEMSSTLAPIEQKNNETRFETEFSKYEKIEGLADHKNDLRKTFLRNPSQSLKALIGEVVTDLQLNKVKPVESTPSSPSRGKVDTSNLSKEELYDMLDTLKE